MPCFGTMEMDSIISDWYYKGTVLKGIIGKYNFFEKFHGKNIWKLQYVCVLSKCVL